MTGTSERKRDVGTTGLGEQTGVKERKVLGRLRPASRAKLVVLEDIVEELFDVGGAES